MHVLRKVDGILKKLWKREIITYFIVGVLTTVINISIYDIVCNDFQIPNLLANAGAWFISVLFAFGANDRIVFVNSSKSSNLFSRAAKFYGARLVSLLLDEAGMYILVDIFLVNNMLSKIFMNGVVIIVNYIVSKRYIFK